MFDKGRCKGMTKSGSRCKRKALEGEKYCQSHMPVEIEPIEEPKEEIADFSNVTEPVDSAPEEAWDLDIPKEEYIEHLSALGIKADKSMSQEQLEKLFEDYQKEQDGIPTELNTDEWDSFPKKDIEKKKGPEGRMYFVKPEDPTTIKSSEIETLVIRENEIVIILKVGTKWRWET